MGFSSREIFLVLRARDEASRTLHRVSNTMSKMDRDAAAASASMITAQRSQLQALTRNAADITAAYSNASAAAKRLYDDRADEHARAMVDLRRRVDDVNRAYQETSLAARNLRDEGKLDADKYRAAMREAQILRANNLESLRRERYAIEDSARANQRHYQMQMENLRKTKLEQQSQLRMEQRAAQESLKFHQERIQQAKEQHRLVRQNGRQMMQNGMVATSMGASMTVAGGMGIAVIKNLVQETMSYRQEVARTMTQVDNGQTRVNDVYKMGLKVAKEVPVAFEQIQPALYDIFSSIDVGTKGASKLLKQFAKDAVGGTSTMEVAARANLQIMNAWKVETKDAAKVSDFMFQLVRKGVGTYDEFAKSIGKAIPSARRAGQSYQTLGAMMAFMTRNGVSASIAATSSARALDAISNSKVEERLKKIGIQVHNAKGEFRDLPDILSDVKKHMDKMSGPEQANFLQELFKGAGGTIQARRFFDMYFKNADEFKKRTKDMANAAGTAGDAFKRMKETPEAKLQAFANSVKRLKIAMGEHLLPTVLFLIEGFNRLVNAFDALPAPVKKVIMGFFAITTVLLVAVGLFVMISGAIMLVAGAAGALGISAGTLVGIFSGFLVVGAIVAGIGLLIYKNWEKLEPIFKRVGTAIKENLQKAWNWLKDTFGPGVAFALALLGLVWDWVVDQMKKAWKDFKEDVDWEQLKRDIEGVKTAFKQFGSVIKENQEVVTLFVVMALAPLIVTILTVITVFRLFIAFIGGAFNGVFSGITTIIQGFIQNVGGIITILNGVITFIQGAFTGNWSKAWKGIEQIFSGTISAIEGAAKAIYGTLQIFWGFIQGVTNMFKKLYDVLVGHSIVPDLINSIIAWFAKLPGNVIGTVGRMVAGAIGSIATLPVRFAVYIVQMVTRAGTEAGKLWPRMKTAIGDIFGKAAAIGKNVIRGLISGIGELAGDLFAKARSIADTVISTLKNAFKIHSPSKRTFDIGQNLMEGLVKGMKSGEPALKDQTDVIEKVLGNIGKKMKPKKRQKFIASIVKANSKDLGRLRDLAKQYRAKSEELDAAKKTLEDKQKEKDDFIKSYSDNIRSFGSISSIGRPTDVFGNEEDQSAGNILAGLQGKLATIQQYGQNLRSLMGLGYTQNVYEQVVRMGPEAGAEYAAALVKATPDQIKGINDTVGQIDTMAAQIATSTASQMYDSGIQTAQALVKGLEAELANIEIAATQIADTIVKAIRKRLKIKSPSRVALSLAGNFAGTFHDELGSYVKPINKVSDNLARAAIFGPDAMTMRTASSTPGGTSYSAPTTGTTINQEVTVNTQEIDPRRHAEELGFELAGRFRV